MNTDTPVGRFGPSYIQQRIGVAPLTPSQQGPSLDEYRDRHTISDLQLLKLQLEALGFNVPYRTSTYSNSQTSPTPLDGQWRIPLTNVPSTPIPSTFQNEAVLSAYRDLDYRDRESRRIPIKLHRTPLNSSYSSTNAPSTSSSTNLHRATTTILRQRTRRRQRDSDIAHIPKPTTKTSGSQFQPVVEDEEDVQKSEVTIDGFDTEYSTTEFDQETRKPPYSKRNNARQDVEQGGRDESLHGIDAAIPAQGFARLIKCQSKVPSLVSHNERPPVLFQPRVTPSSDSEAMSPHVYPVPLSARPLSTKVHDKPIAAIQVGNASSLDSFRVPETDLASSPINPINGIRQSNTGFNSTTNDAIQDCFMVAGTCTHNARTKQSPTIKRYEPNDSIIRICDERDSIVRSAVQHIEPVISDALRSPLPQGPAHVSDETSPADHISQDTSGMLSTSLDKAAAYDVHEQRIGSAMDKSVQSMQEARASPLVSVKRSKTASPSRPKLTLITSLLSTQNVAMKREVDIFSPWRTQANNVVREETPHNLLSHRCSCGAVDAQENTCYSCRPCGGVLYCDSCWHRAPLHKGNEDMSQTGGLHEKADPRVGVLLYDTFDLTHSASTIQRAHENNLGSAWFGISTSIRPKKAALNDYGGMQRLLKSLYGPYRRAPHPALIAFLGEVGAGKSTLIKLLVKLSAQYSGQFATPVTASCGQRAQPTSSEVHVFADPTTLMTDRPILYIDSEGLGAGQVLPSGAHANAPGDNHDVFSPASSNGMRRSVHEYDIEWATTNHYRSRQFHAYNLYPRLLYHFCDTLVYVMNTDEELGRSIERVIDWAEASVASSTEFVLRPNLLFVINRKIEVSPTTQENLSTFEDFLQLCGTIDQNPKLKETAARLTISIKQPSDIQLLLECFFTSVDILRLSGLSNTSCMASQVSETYNKVSGLCRKAHEARSLVRQSLEPDEMQLRIERTFEHLSLDLDKPFDIASASSSISSLIPNVTVGLLDLAVKVTKNCGDAANAKAVFKGFCRLIASIIMLDTARRSSHGTVKSTMLSYAGMCNDVLTDFCKRHWPYDWPCEEVSEVHGRCISGSRSHVPHAHRARTGETFGHGGYKASLKNNEYHLEFLANIYGSLEKQTESLHETFRGSSIARYTVAARLHRDVVLSPFFQQHPAALTFAKHSMCCCCFMNSAIHPLWCGHVLCTQCVRAFAMPRVAKSKSQHVLEMQECPLHLYEAAGQSVRGWPVFIHNQDAGLRILSLDGSGGAGNLSQIIFLQQLEIALGRDLPVQAFFDLVVGSNYGSIVALGMAAKGWNTQNLLERFKEICRTAFSPRRIAAIDNFKTFTGAPRSPSETLEAVIQRAFGTKSLFAGTDADKNDIQSLYRRTKVAVPVVDANGKRKLLTNYRLAQHHAQSPNHPIYEAPTIESEVTICEAVRAATASAPTHRSVTNRGSAPDFANNIATGTCPADCAMEQAEMIAQSASSVCVDIILSLGAGGEFKRSASLERRSSRSTSVHKDSLNSPRSPDAASTWSKYVSEAIARGDEATKYVRFDAEFKCGLESPISCPMSRWEEQARMDYAANKSEMQSLARRLLATSFCFSIDRELDFRDADEHLFVPIIISCRFNLGSAEIIALGKALRDRRRRASHGGVVSYYPYFVVHEDGQQQLEPIPLTNEAITRMVVTGTFQDLPIWLRFSKQSSPFVQVFICFGDDGADDQLHEISKSGRYLTDELVTDTRQGAVPSTPGNSPQTPNIDWALVHKMSREMYEEEFGQLEKIATVSRPHGPNDILSGSRSALDAPSRGGQKSHAALSLGALGTCHVTEEADTETIVDIYGQTPVHGNPSTILNNTRAATQSSMTSSTDSSTRQSTAERRNHGSKEATSSSLVKSLFKAVVSRRSARRDTNLSKHAKIDAWFKSNATVVDLGSELASDQTTRRDYGGYYKGVTQETGSTQIYEAPSAANSPEWTEGCDHLLSSNVVSPAWTKSAQQGLPSTVPSPAWVNTVSPGGALVSPPRRPIVYQPLVYRPAACHELE